MGNAGGMIWVILIFGGMFLFTVDRAFGLAFLVASFGVVALVAGIAGVSGVNLANYGVVLNLLLITVFVPAAMRLAFVLHASDTSPGKFEARNGRQALRGILVARGLLSTFVTHLVTSGMLLISLAMLARWVPPDPMFLVAGSVAGLHLGGVVAEARGVNDPRKKINWRTAGLAVGALVAAGVLYLSLYWWTMAAIRGEAMPC